MTREDISIELLQSFIDDPHGPDFGTEMLMHICRLINRDFAGETPILWSLLEQKPVVEGNLAAYQLALRLDGWATSAAVELSFSGGARGCRRHLWEVQD